MISVDTIIPQKFGGQLVEVAQKDAVSGTVAALTDKSNNQQIVNSTSISSDQILIASGKKILPQLWQGFCWTVRVTVLL